MIKKLLYTGLYLFSATLFAQQAYYNDVNLSLSGTALRDELATKIIATHTKVLGYGWGADQATDVNPNDASKVLLIYGWEDGSDSDCTNDLERGINENGGSSCNWNREHVYSKSLGTPSFSNGSTPGSDGHHIRASDVSRNGQRGNKLFASGSGNSKSVTGGWYPGDKWKGDVARIVMYMYLRYGNQCLPKNVGVGTANSVDSNMINLFLEWNAEDPVSQQEKNRNTYLSNDSNTYGQGNRNPFIDNPNLATQIWGGTPAENLWNNNSSDTEAPSSPTNLTADNITNSSVTLTWTASTDNIAVTAYQIFVDGSLSATTNNNTFIVSGLSAATFYTFTVKAKDAAGNTSVNNPSVNATTLNGNNTGGNNSLCVEESFGNIGDSSSSYSTVTWTGDNGFEWTATEARTDQTINNEAITIRNGELTASGTSGGIGSFTVTTQRVFSGGSGTFDLNVNGTKVGTISYSDTKKTTTIDNINIANNVSVSITNNSSSSNRVMFDDLSWICFSATASTVQHSLSDVLVYPNPTLNGKVTITFPSNTNITNVEVFSVLGKRIYNRKNPTILENKITIQHLKTGIYILKLSNSSQSVTKKLVVR